MKENLRFLTAALALAATVSMAMAPPAAAEPTTDIRSFVTQIFIHGLPYDQAEQYGPEALPELVQMLGDPALEVYWANIVMTMGIIGDSAAVQPLRQFLAFPREEEVSPAAFRALLSVLPALGYLAQEDDDALAALTAWCEINHWKSARLQWHHGRYRDDALGEVLGRVAIQGLGVSGRDEALATLEAMVRDTSVREDWQDNLDEAITLNLKVASLGPKNVFGAGGDS